MLKKHVATFDALSWGFRELSHHLTMLIPLSALFYAPEISARFHLEWPMPLRDVFHTAFFFILLLRAMKLTKPKDSKAPQGSARAFALGEILKILAQAAGFAVGALMLALWLTWHDPALLAAIFNLRFSKESLDEVIQLFKAEPLWDQIVEVVLLGWLPLRAHVMLNFFGYIVADRGGSAQNALRESIRLGKGVQLQLMLFYGVCLALIFAGFKLYIVGAIFAFPATVLATVYVYRELEQWRDDV